MATKKGVKLFILAISAVQFVYAEWTWQHFFTFTPSECQVHQKKKIILIERKELNLFKQAVLSWNAERPKQGYFSFDLRVRNAKNGVWSDWHHMADWGSVQRSYFDNGDGICQAHYVRLELEKNKYADAFMIRVSAHNEASLDLVHGCYLSLSNYEKFKQESTINLCSLPSIMIKKVPRLSQLLVDHQRNYHICSPTSCAMVIQFLTGCQVCPADFADAAYDEGLDTYGSWPFNIAHAYELSGKKYLWYVTRLDSFEDLYHHIEKGVPVIISVRGEIEGAPKSYPHGHLLVVVGWNKRTQTVVCHDPAAKKQKQVVHHYSLNNLLRAWDRSYRLAYIAKKIP